MMTKTAATTPSTAAFCWSLQWTQLKARARASTASTSVLNPLMRDEMTVTGSVSLSLSGWPPPALLLLLLPSSAGGGVACVVVGGSMTSVIASASSLEIRDTVTDRLGEDRDPIPRQ